MTDCRLCPAGTVALHLASALAAGAAGNRTRQRRETPLSGFEDRRQRGRPCSSFAKRGLRAPVMAGVLRVDPEEIRPHGRRAKTRTDHLRLAAQYLGWRAPTTLELKEPDEFPRAQAMEHDSPTLLFRSAIHNTGPNSPLDSPGAAGRSSKPPLGSRARTTILRGKPPGTPCAAGRPGNRAEEK